MRTFPQILLYPLQNLKNRMLSDFEAVPNYSGVLDCIIKVYAREGLMGFYRGFAWQLLCSLFDIAVATLQYKLRLMKDDGYPSTLKNIPLELVTDTIRSGLEVLNLRSSIGLPLVAPGATGFGKVKDIYVGLPYDFVPIMIKQTIVLTYLKFG